MKVIYTAVLLVSLLGVAAIGAKQCSAANREEGGSCAGEEGQENEIIGNLGKNNLPRTDDQGRLVDEDGKVIIGVDEAHRAEYAIMAQIHFHRIDEARDALADIRYGYKSFSQIAEERNQRSALSKEMAVSGEMGLVKYKEVDPVIADIAFDVRRPITKSAEDIQGPVCGKKGCYLFSVFHRYRRGFFSREWYEAEEYAESHGTTLGQLLEGMSQADSVKQLAFSIWPDEHISQKKIKIEQLKSDMNRVGKRDFSAEPPEEDKATRYKRQNPDLSKHEALMAKRKKLFEVIPAETIAEHPEIYGMSIDQIIEEGWVPDSAIGDFSC